MDYRTTSKQAVIWDLLAAAERAHIKLTISDATSKNKTDEIAHLETNIKYLQDQLKETEEVK